MRTARGRQVRREDPARARRALLCPFASITRGHVVRCLALGESLAARGFHVGMAGPRTLRKEVIAAGFEFVDDASADRMRELGPLPVPERAKFVRAMLEDARLAQRSFAPHVVVGDLSPAIHVAAALEGLPSVALANLELFRFPMGQWLKMLGAAFEELDLPSWAATRTFGDALVVGDTSDWVGLRDLGPEADSLVRSVREIHFVGPILRGEVTPWKLPSRRTRPSVVISFGGGPSPGAHVFDGCRGIDADYDVIVAGKPSAESRKAAEALRKSIHGSVNFCPFDDAFPSRIANAHVLVAQAGHGTVVQALAVGVPTLLVPLHREQTLNANRLVGLGEFTPEGPESVRATLGPKLRALLGDRKRDRARRSYAASMRAYGGVAHAARVVDVISRSKDRAH